MDRFSYKNYKDDRDCRTKKLITKDMYILINIKRKPFIHRDGYLIAFYKLKDGIKYIRKYKGEDIWKVKKVKLDITTL